MSEHNDNPEIKARIPAVAIDRSYIGLYANLDRISTAAHVTYQPDRGSVTLYLGDLMVELPLGAWRPIADALNDVLDRVTDDIGCDCGAEEGRGDRMSADDFAALEHAPGSRMSDAKNTATVVLTTDERRLVTRLLLIERDAEAKFLAAIKLVDWMPKATAAAADKVQMLTGLVAKLDEAYAASVREAVAR